MLAETIGMQAASYHEAMVATEPVTLTMPQVDRVGAALAMMVKLAAEHVERTKADAAGMIHDAADAADAIAVLGATQHEARGAETISFGGRPPVWGCGVLVRANELTREAAGTAPATQHTRRGPSARYSRR
jgi:hypothetical protein